MHGTRETSCTTRLVCTVLHAALLGVAAWIYFGDGGVLVWGWLGVGHPCPGDFPRRLVLFSFGIVLFGRMLVTQFYLLKRKFSWDELGGVLFALLLYQVGFALLGGYSPRSLGPIDVFGVGLFVVGSYLNTGSELQRNAFKERAENAGRLYTGGLFRYARHINYFGDVLWVGAWALVTRNAWSAVVPLVLTAGFIFVFIPSLASHLRERYGSQYDEWARHTRALIPYIY